MTGDLYLTCGGVGRGGIDCRCSCTNTDISLIRIRKGSGRTIRIDCNTTLSTDCNNPEHRNDNVCLKLYTFTVSVRV